MKKRFLRLLPIVAALAAFLVALLLVSDLNQDESGFGWHYMWVVICTGGALVLLIATIAHRVITLVGNIRSEEPGARLSARWVRNFLVLSLPPALIVYLFSAFFLTRTVDSWFDVQVERALADSLELGQQFLNTRTREVRNQLRRLARDIEVMAEEPDQMRRALLNTVSASGPQELSVLEMDGSVLSTANFNALTGLPDRPGDYAMLQARERGEYAAAEPAPAGGLQIRVLQQLAAASPGNPELLLQALYPLPGNITALTDSIEREYYRYQNVSYLRNSLKQSFLLILSLVLLLTVFLAILAALTAARRMVSPISRLAHATRQVTAGDLKQAVDIQTRDELGFLAQSFNDMTRALLQASDQAETGRARLQAQGEYLETVLGNLSAGVLTLDEEQRIVRANKAAEQILQLPAGFALGRALRQVEEIAPFLGVFVDTVEGQAQRGRAEWQREIRLQRAGARLVLLVRGSRLPALEGDAGGWVIVFDDVTVLNQAQRDAAWAEVARRLAHEVKNPLTPIRLAAERVRMKLMDKLDAGDSTMLDRAASTIVSQVEALRAMVDAFGDYASEPDLDRQELALDRLIEDVVALYQEGNPNLRMKLDLCPGPQGLAADSGQIRQLLHNLIRNSSEAAGAGAGARIAITTRRIERDGQPWLQLRVSDEGPGFPGSVLDKPFEPYVTSKQNGSGLGLAICRKIVENHDGSIAISNPPKGGARANILLPLKAGQESRRSRETSGSV